jgi:hypothetical protein
MRVTLQFLLMSSVLVGVPANAAAGNCPPRETGTYPWTKYGTVKGDEWAWVYLELDKKGWAKRCLMGENNIDDSDRRFFVCRAMKQDWRPATKDGALALASTTVKRFFLIPGPDHEKQMREAKKRFFAEHPDERPECYPDD